MQVGVRVRGRPFKKGTPKPANSGRKKGVRNKVTREVKDFLREMVNDPQVQAAFRKQLVRGDRGAMQAFLGSTHLIIGRPKESVEVSTSPSMSKMLLLALQTANEMEAEQRGRGGKQAEVRKP